MREKQKRMPGDDVLIPLNQYKVTRTQSNPTVRAAQWGCLGTVLAAIILGLASMFVQTPTTQGTPQPIIVAIFQAIFNQDGYSSVVTASTLPFSGAGTLQPTHSPIGVTPMRDRTSTVTYTPTSTTIPPSPSASPVLIDTIEVLGSSNTGTEFTAPQTGRYSLKFNSGGYCTHGANPGFPTCLPTIWIFERGADLWEDDGRTLNQNNASRIIAPVSDCGAGRGAYCNTIDDAELQGLNSSEVRMNLVAGSVWILIGVDHREAYLDNPGTVFIDLFYQPE